MSFIRRLFFLGILLCTALFAGLWTRGRQMADLVDAGEWNGGRFHILSSRGRINLLWTDIPAPHELYPPRWLSYQSEFRGQVLQTLPHYADSERRFGCVTLWREKNPQVIDDNGLWWLHGNCRIRGIAFPIWPLAVTGAAALLLTGIARLVRSRRCAGKALCANCGYDLRASGEICPECGRARHSAKPSFIRRLTAPTIAVLCAFAVAIVLDRWPARQIPRAQVVGIWANSKVYFSGLRDYMRLDDDGHIEWGTTAPVIANRAVWVPEYDHWHFDGDLLILESTVKPAWTVNAWFGDGKMMQYATSVPEGYIINVHARSMPTSRPDELGFTGPR